MTTSLVHSSVSPGSGWLRVPERIRYKLAVLTYKVLHERAPRYLDSIVRVTDVPGRRTLRSAGSVRLLVPPACVTASSAESLSGFGGNTSVPAVLSCCHSVTVLLFHCDTVSGLCSGVCYLCHYKNYLFD